MAGLVAGRVAELHCESATASTRGGALVAGVAGLAVITRPRSLGKCTLRDRYPLRESGFQYVYGHEVHAALCANMSETTLLRKLVYNRIVAQ